jgi:hypothetical protein
VTATRDRRSDPEEDAEPAWSERSIFGKSRGLPWWGAVLLAFGLAAIAAAFDMQRADSLGRVYQGAYIVGCVAAICLVRRSSLFGPMVQPPLVFAVTAVAAVVLLAPDTGGDGGLKSLIFSVALPLTSNFPTMAITTGATVAIGLFRLYRERDPDLGLRPREQRRAGRREADELEFGARDDTGSRRRPEPRGETGRRGTDPTRRGERRGEPGRRGAPGRRGEPEDRRGAAGRRGDDTGRGRTERGRGRPDADPDGPDGRRGFGRRGRPDQSTRDSRGAERPSRTRARAGDDPPPRRRESDRPRREDRARRDPGERGSRQSRSPKDPYR